MEFISTDNAYVFDAKLYPNGIFQGYMICKDRCHRISGSFAGDWFIYHGWLRLTWNWRNKKGYIIDRLDIMNYY